MAPTPRPTMGCSRPEALTDCIRASTLLPSENSVERVAGEALLPADAGLAPWPCPVLPSSPGAGAGELAFTAGCLSSAPRVVLTAKTLMGTFLPCTCSNDHVLVKQVKRWPRASLYASAVHTQRVWKPMRRGRRPNLVFHCGRPSRSSQGVPLSTKHPRPCLERHGVQLREACAALRQLVGAVVAQHARLLWALRLHHEPETKQANPVVWPQLAQNTWRR